MKTNYINQFNRDAFSDFASGAADSASGGSIDLQTGLTSGLNAIAPGTGAVLGVLTSLFSNKPNPNDWQGWNAQDRQAGRPEGSSVAFWTITDGDSVQNEALNIISYIRSTSDGLQKVLKAANFTYSLSSDQYLNKLSDKLRRGGFPNEATQFANAIKSSPLTGSNAQGILNQNSTFGTNGTMQSGAPNIDTTAAAKATAASKKTWLIVGIVAAVIVIGVLGYLAFKNKK